MILEVGATTPQVVHEFQHTAGSIAVVPETVKARFDVDGAEQANPETFSSPNGQSLPKTNLY